MKKAVFLFSLLSICFGNANAESKEPLVVITDKVVATSSDWARVAVKNGAAVEAFYGYSVYPEDVQNPLARQDVAKMKSLISAYEQCLSKHRLCFLYESSLVAGDLSPNGGKPSSRTSVLALKDENFDLGALKTYVSEAKKGSDQSELSAAYNAFWKGNNSCKLDSGEDCLLRAMTIDTSSTGDQSVVFKFAFAPAKHKTRSGGLLFCDGQCKF